MPEARILVIGRMRSKQENYVNALKRRYDVVVVPSGRQGAELADANPPHAVVLDAISMRTPGERICRELRDALPVMPIVHLYPGPKGEIHSAADVVLFEPFTSRKLINNIERLLRFGDDKIVACGPFSINLVRRVLVAHGQESQLTPKLARLVEIFLRHPGETLDRKTLMEKVWQTDYLGDTRTLDVHIRWIREAVEAVPGKPEFLKTVRGVGYRLEIPVEEPVSVFLAEMGEPLQV
ncbi:MAG: response regulator transcription factor [Burkholderiales bacterium]|nr:response regulator transcription factor [Anaerolineae bacterium]